MGHRKQPFGYGMENGEIVIIRQEAEIVQGIFQDYIAGISFSSLADNLNGRNVKYSPEKTWNKLIIARLLADERYIGRQGFPPIISEETLSTASAIRSGKCSVQAVSATQKALRHLSGNRPPPDLEQVLLRWINRLIEKPDLIQSPVAEYRTNGEEVKLQTALDRILEEPVPDESVARELILQLAGIRYDALDCNEYETQRLRNLLAGRKPLTELEASLLLESISSITADPVEGIVITLQNGQRIGERGGED